MQLCVMRDFLILTNNVSGQEIEPIAERTNAKKADFKLFCLWLTAGM